MLKHPCRFALLSVNLDCGGALRQCDATSAQMAFRACDLRLCPTRSFQFHNLQLRPHVTNRDFLPFVAFTPYALRTSHLLRTVAANVIPVALYRGSTYRSLTLRPNTTTDFSHGPVTCARSGAGEDRTRPKVPRYPDAGKRREEWHRVWE